MIEFKILYSENGDDCQVYLTGQVDQYGDKLLYRLNKMCELLDADSLIYTGGAFRFFFEANTE